MTIQTTTAIEPHDVPKIPGAVLGAAALLIAVSIALAVLAKTTDIGATRLSVAPPAQARDFYFTLNSDESVSVRDAKTKALVAALPASGHGFIKILLKDFAQQRSASGIAETLPLRLSRREGGEPVMEDPATGRIILLNAFGKSNANAFAHLLDIKDASL